MEALATQLQNLARSQTNETAHLAEAANDLEELAESIANLDADKRESLAASLAQASAHVARAGDSDLAQALAALAQAARLGAGEPAAQAARDAVDALAEAQGKLADQAALQRTLSQLQAGRQAIAKAGQGQAVAQGQGRGPSQSQGQGQGQQGQPGAGGGTKADRLPPARRSGQAGLPQGEGQPGSLGEFNQQIYVPRERRQGSGDQLTISGQETGQGDIQIGNQGDPLPGSAGQALVPYQEVYHNYLDAVNQTMERSYIPSGLKDYVREYFSQLEP